MPQKSRISSQIIDPEAFQLNRNDSCLLGQEQRWALRPFLIVWSPVLEKKCEPVWDLKKKKTTTKKPHINALSFPGWCQMSALCLGKLFLSWSLLFLEAVPAPTPCSEWPRWKGSLKNPDFSLQARLASAVSPTELSYFSWSAPLPFLILSWRLNCLPWVKSLSNSTLMPRSAGKPFDWLYYLFRKQ